MAKKTVDTSIEEVTFDIQLNQKQMEALVTEANEVFFGGSKAGGKLLELNTDILTTYGWKKMKDVHPGDYVYGADGEPALVVAESEVDFDEDTYALTFDDSSTIIAGARHQWITQTYKERVSNSRRTSEARAKRRASRPSRSTGKCPWLAERNSSKKYEYDDEVRQEIRTTEEIFNTLKITTGNQTHINHAIPLQKPLQFPEKDLPIHPYVLGSWLADGSRGSGGYTGIDAEIWEKFESLGYEITHNSSVDKQHYIKGIVPALRDLGVLHEKHIPEIYKFSSYEQRLELIRGVFDGDGSISERGKSEISLSDELLFDGVLFVLNSLGIKCNKNRNKAFFIW